MPRSWIGRPYWLQRLTPQTWSWPLIATGVVPVGGGVVGGGVVGGGGVLGGGVLGGGVEVPPVQTVPLSVNEVGLGFDPVQEPLKPTVVLAPVPSAPL